MMTASRREWNELYTLFRLLAQGFVNAGTVTGDLSGKKLPIAGIRREEHDGTRSYLLDGESVSVVGEGWNESFPREDFGVVADMLLNALTSHPGDAEIEAPDGVEAFLDALRIYDMEAQTNDRTDFYVWLYSLDTEPVGLRIYSRLCGMSPLLDGGRTANLKFEQTGVRFSQPAVNKINYTDDPDNPNEVARRIMYIESLGGVLRYSDVADKIFRSNLLMIDLHFPRLAAEMVRTMHLDNVSRLDELTQLIEQKNPLKIKEELITKHGYYRYKVKQFLLALAFGLRPAKIFNGVESAVSGFLMVNQTGELCCYTKADREVFADYLFTHTRLEKGVPAKDKYGLLERENRLYYVKLNLKVGFCRR